MLWSSLRLMACCLLFTGSLHAQPLRFFSSEHPFIRYTGRIDHRNATQPRLWTPGAYLTIYVQGDSCAFVVQDQQLQRPSQNYLEIVTDDTLLQRVMTKGASDTIGVRLPRSKPGTIHKVLLCKNTETNIGYIAINGIYAASLCRPPAAPVRTIECIGNSITCGTGSDLSQVACHQGQWHDQHNAYLSYGPVTARALQANWHLTAVSGIGLMHSCCNLQVTMPQVFDKIALSGDSIPWSFTAYTPDVVTICLGQNDGIQDSASFCRRYIAFLSTIRSHYPEATLICLSSPMADSTLLAFMKTTISAIVADCRQRGDTQVHSFFFSKRYHHGCDDHPDLEEHRQIAKELTAYIRQVTGWQ